jgi:acyl-CoA-binding protein
MSKISKEIEDNFKFAADAVRNSESGSGSKAPSNEVKLKFYSLYKQATIGPCNTPQPWKIDFENRAKWDAWNDLGNMSREDAMVKYCESYLATLEK